VNPSYPAHGSRCVKTGHPLPALAPTYKGQYKDNVDVVGQCPTDSTSQLPEGSASHTQWYNTNKQVQTSARRI